MYLDAEEAQDYYATNNTAIGNRATFLERRTNKRVKVTFHRLRNGFFPKAVKKLVLYLMGNGATLKKETKAKIDRKFDNKMIIGTIFACVDGVNWAFHDIDKLVFFRATEFAPLFDERTGNPMAGIRFWQIDKNKPMYIELYEIDGITEYKSTNGSIEETLAKRTYQADVKSYPNKELALPDEIEEQRNYEMFPIFPLYANELKISELTIGLKALIDAYDFISSDLVDNITLIEGIYGLIKNYDGQDPSQLLREMQELKVILTEGEHADADLKALEVPFQGKQACLELLEKRMYDDWLLPDKRRDGGAGITATEIRDAREDLDIKADLLEWQVAETIENILKINGINEPLEDFKRRTNNNDTETVENIATSMGGAPWRTYRDAINDDPTIPQDEKEERIKAMDLAETGVPDDLDDETGGAT